MSGRYARWTRVPVAQTRAEIERMLTRYGARQFFSGWDSDARAAVVGFAVLADDGHPRQVRLRLPLPDPKAERSEQRRAQAERAAWRALLLVIKAKLEAVASGISTIEREFLADLMLPDGRTLGEWAAPQIAAIYATGSMPGLLLTDGGGA